LNFVKKCDYKEFDTIAMLKTLRDSGADLHFKKYNKT